MRDDTPDIIPDPFRGRTMGCRPQTTYPLHTVRYTARYVGFRSSAVEGILKVNCTERKSANFAAGRHAQAYYWKWNGHSA